MGPNNTKFNFNESLEQMDYILKSGDVIVNRDPSIPLNTKGAKGIVMFASVVGVKFTPIQHTNANQESWARVKGVLLTQLYALVASQPLLLNLDWDGNWLHAIFNTTTKDHIDATLDSVAKILSLTDVINFKIKETGWSFDSFAAFDYRKVLAISAESGTMLWTIDQVTDLDKLLEGGDYKRLIITEIIYNNLKSNYQDLFIKDSLADKTTYHASIVNIGMNNWLKENK